MKRGDKVVISTDGFDPNDGKEGKVCGISKKNWFLVKFGYSTVGLLYHRDELKPIISKG